MARFGPAQVLVEEGCLTSVIGLVVLVGGIIGLVVAIF